MSSFMAHVALEAATSLAPGAAAQISTDRALFRDVTISACAGRSLVLLGPNGCGKTSLARALLGLAALSSGRRTVSPGVSFAYMPQDYRYAFFPWLSIRRNVALRLRETANSQSDTDDPHPLVGEMDTLYTRLDLQVDSGRYPDQVSGGQLQLVLFVATLVMPGNVRVLDEPFSALDFRRRAIASELLAERVAARADDSWVIITHDIAEGVQLADQLAVFGTARSISAQVNVEMPWPRRLDFRETPAALSAIRTVREAVGIA